VERATPRGAGPGLGPADSVALINRARRFRALFIRNPHPPIRTTAETADREPVVPAAFTVKFTVGFVQHQV
jgi:hypothetical protein